MNFIYLLFKGMNQGTLNRLENLGIQYNNGYYYGNRFFKGQGSHFQKLKFRLNTLTQIILQEEPEKNLELLWKRWKKLSYRFSGSCNCLCGKCIKYCFTIQRRNIRVIIGSKCIKNFGMEAENTLRELRITTCDKCACKIKNISEKHIYGKKICFNCSVGNAPGVYY